MPEDFDDKPALSAQIVHSHNCGVALQLHLSYPRGFWQLPIAESQG